MDAHGFSAAMDAGRIPDVSTLTYEGIFNENTYYVGPPEESKVVTTASFPIMHNGDPWAAVFLKSKLDGQPRNETPIDLSVVLDISGSMSAGMTYDSADHTGERRGNRLDFAKMGVEWLVNEVLRPDDGIAVSTFNSQGHAVTPLTRLDTFKDKEEFLAPVRDVNINGGTVLAAGMQVGREAFVDMSEARHRRILFLTDMGEMGATTLDNMIKQQAEDGVYVSIVAMGAEFNSSLTDAVCKNKGSNYFCATNESQLRDCIVRDFDYNMFPGAFDINVFVRSGALDVSAVYGLCDPVGS